MAGRRALPETLTTGPRTKCAICTLGRNSCPRNCVFAPHVDRNKAYNDLFILFTHQKLKKLISRLEDSRRGEFLDGKVYEAKMNVKDPVRGCLAVSEPELLKEIEFLKLENAYRRKKDERRDSGDRLIIETLAKGIENGEDSRFDTWMNINGGSGASASQPTTGISIGGSRPDLQQYVEFLKQENARRRKKDESRDSRDKSIIEMLSKDLEYDEGSRRDTETGFATNGGSSSRPVAQRFRAGRSHVELATEFDGGSRPVASQPVIGAAVSQGFPAGSSRMNLWNTESNLPAVTHGYTTGGLGGEMVAEGDAPMREAGLRFDSSVQNVDGAIEELGFDDIFQNVDDIIDVSFLGED